MTNQEIDKRVERAVENFMAGYGCCQSVVAAFADLYGLDDTLAKKVAAGFGGGVGRMRMMCGAVSGIVIPRAVTVRVSRPAIRSFRSCWPGRNRRTAV